MPPSGYAGPVYSPDRIGGIGQVSGQAGLGQGTWRRGAFWIPGVLAAVSVGVAVGLTLAEATGHQIDFDIYRMGAGHVFGRDLYSVRLSRALMGGSPGMRFTYPPFAAVLFVPFSWLPVKAGQITWSLLNLAALYAVAVVSIRAARPQCSHRTACGIAALALLPILRLDPAALPLALGQVNLVTAFILLA